MTTAISRPPRSWESQTWALLVLAAASALACLVTLVTLLGVRNVIATRGASGTSVLTDWALGHAGLLDNIYFVLVIAYLAAFYWWRARTRQLLIIFGDSGARALIHWALYAWNGLIFFSFLIRILGNIYGAPDPTVDAITDALHRLDVFLLGLTLRLAALIFLLLGVWQSRTRVRAVVAGTIVYSPPPPVRQEPAPEQRTTILETATMPVADDAFWARVRELSLAAGDELPLLESTSNLIRRWSLIPSVSAIDTIRASLPPGTVITVFPTPPQPGAEAPADPPTAEAEQWFGLTEDAGTGMLWFRLLQPSRLPDWLAKARTAQRFGLYRPNDPAALNAVTPAMIQTH
jgi:hypothetical protein